MNRKAIYVIIGLVHAALSQFVSLAMLGAGEGWSEPFFLSLLLFIVNPIIFWRLPSDGKRINIEYILLTFAILSDLIVFYSAVTYSSYAYRILGGLSDFWVFLWMVWQVVLVCSIGNKRNFRYDDLD